MISTINGRIAMYRKLAGFTQAQAAEKLGMKYTTYAQMERKGTVSTTRLLDMAAVFGIKPEDLLYGESSYNYRPTQESVVTLHQEPVPLFKGPAPIVITNQEENIIKIIRNFSKADRDDVISYIEKKYKDAKNRKK